MAFWEQWRRYYPLPQTFEIRGKSTINEVNQQEAGDYLQAHNQTAQGEPSIDRRPIPGLLSSGGCGANLGYRAPAPATGTGRSRRTMPFWPWI